jgi:hypothetical protein
MFDLMFADGVRRGMAFDSPSHPRIFVTKSGSSLTAADWARLKPGARRKLVGDDLPPSPRTPGLPTSDELDDEGRMAALHRYLSDKGLTMDDIAEACRLAREGRGGETDDELPVSGARHAALPRGGSSVIKEHREPGGKIYATDKRPSRLEELGVMRVQTGVPGRSQFDPPSDRRSEGLAFDSKSARKGFREKFGKHFTQIGVGEWPQRKW